MVAARKDVMPRKTGVRNSRFAGWFAMARKKARLTQEELAEQLDVSQGAITNWEREGVETMTPAMIKKLARVLDVKPVEIAAALGYPTVAAPPVREEPPEGDADPVFIATEIARLSSRLADLLAEETAAENGGAPARSGRERG